MMRNASRFWPRWSKATGSLRDFNGAAARLGVMVDTATAHAEAGDSRLMNRLLMKLRRRLTDRCRHPDNAAPHEASAARRNSAGASLPTSEGYTFQCLEYLIQTRLRVNAGACAAGWRDPGSMRPAASRIQ